MFKTTRGCSNNASIRSVAQEIVYRQSADGPGIGIAGIEKDAVPQCGDRVGIGGSARAQCGLLFPFSQHAGQQQCAVPVFADMVGGVAHRGVVVGVTVGVEIESHADALQIVETGDALGPGSGLVQGRQQQRGQNRDDCYYIDLKKLIS